MAAHLPVLMNEVVAGLAPQANDIVVDATFGRGGYSRTLLESAPCKVVGIDRDPDAVAIGREMEREYAGRFTILHGPFSQMVALLDQIQIKTVQRIVFDLGVSSPQLDEAERGFSFRKDGPLDMRMSKEGSTAADLVNQTPEAELANIIYQYGEERSSRKIAKAIIAQRKVQKFTRTLELAQLIESIIPRRDETHPATKTFQAIRIAVNAEFKELELALEATETLLQPNGRLAVVTFHSLEDRIVKNFLRERAGKISRGSRHKPDTGNHVQPAFSLISNKAIAPSRDEILQNPRARSAKLRLAQRLETSMRENDAA